MVISYKIFETSLQLKACFINFIEVTMSVSFCLSHDPRYWGYIAFKRNIISMRKHLADAVFVSDVSCMCQNITCVVI